MMLTGIQTVVSQSQPSISSFSPTTASAGSVVTILGNNFNLIADNNIVFIGATKATVTDASSTNLKVIVPLGASYGLISVTDISTRLTAFSSHKFSTTFDVCSNTFDQISFASSLEYEAVQYPMGVVIEDLDGDGRPDFVVANNGFNTVSVYRNTSINGIISFASKQDFFPGLIPQSIAIGDFNGDGKPDLAVANFNSHTVGVFKNTSVNGVISFGTVQSFNTGTNPGNVSIGDIDGDGKLDLAVANENSNTISILRNTSTSSTISFALKKDYVTSSGPYCVVLGDIDSDGKLDLVVANNYSNSVSVLRNTSSIGNISFALKKDFATSSGPYSAAIGDIDSDGKLDIAVTNNVSGTVSLLRNTSSIGNISFDSKQDISTGEEPVNVVMGDLNKDGKLDLVITNYLSNTVSVFKNTSSIGVISFSSKQDYIIGSNPHSVAMGDIDGDGYPDLAVTSFQTKLVSILINNSGSGAISFISRQGFITDLYPTDFDFGDLDGDGKPDIVVSVNDSQSVSVHRNTSSFDKVTFASKQDYSIGLSPNDVAIRDIDGDGKPDLVVNYYNAISILKNTSNAGVISFAAKHDYIIGVNNIINVSFGDINGDGKLDMIAIGFNLSAQVYINTSVDGIISFAPKQVFSANLNDLNGVNVEDIDGDGKPDIVISGTVAFSILRNTSSGGSISFTLDYHKYITSNNYTKNIAIEDIDGDGKPDLTVAGTNFVSVLKNTSSIGNISFASGQEYVTGISHSRVSLGDLNGDGKPDLVISSGNLPKISVLRNTSNSGNISFASKQDYTTGNSTGIIAIGDINIDGKPDLIVADWSGKLSILRNTILTVINDDVELNGLKLTAAQRGASYQWLNCNDGNNPILGATDRSYIPTTNGSYAVKITYGTCSLTTNCINFATLSVEDEKLNESLVLYPNPTKGVLFVKVNNEELVENLNYSIYDIVGNQIKAGKIINENTAIDLDSFSNGIYLIKLSNKKGKIFKKIILNK